LPHVSRELHDTLHGPDHADEILPRPLRRFTRRHPEWSYVLGFTFAGGVSLVVNLAFLTGAQWLGADEYTAIGVGVAASVVSSFVLNRQLTFRKHGQKPFWRQFGGFLGSSAFGIVLNYGVAAGLVWWLALMPQVAALAGMFVGFTFNYAASRLVIFRPRRREDRDAGRPPPS